jgi:uncharacterized protein YkwD
MQRKDLPIALNLVILALLLSSALPETAGAGPPGPAGQPRLGPSVSEQTGDIFAAYTGCGGIIASVVNAEYEQQVVEMVNAERAAVGRPPLKRVVELERSARYHATDLGQDDYFDHDSYDRSGGSLVHSCGWSARIQSYYADRLSLGENIAAGYSTPQAVMTAWMNSEGHRNNILSTNFWEFGVGYYAGSGDYYRYWVQDFGRRNNVYPVVINREAATTDTVNVSLYIYGQGTWSEMRLRNDDGSWTDWMLFQSNLNWALDGAGGDRTVWVELRNGGQTTLSSDTIYLDAPALGNLPAALQFTYSIPDQQLLPTTHQLTPLNTGNDATLSWQVSKTGAWFSVSPTTGATPSWFWITPTTFDTDNEGTYTGVATVTVTSPSGVSGSPHRIDLTLRVVNLPFHRQYLPMVVKN